jgi:hypothetical protein
MPTIEVLPRPTPEERAETPVTIDVDERIAELVEVIEGWTTPRQNWEFTLQQGQDFGRANNVEARLLFVSGEQTSSLVFRLDQLDDVDDVMDALVLRFEEEDGIAKLARCSATGLDVELFHILTFT